MIKYIHLFLCSETKLKFFPNLVRMIANESCFNARDHLFVATSVVNYNKMIRLMDDEGILDKIQIECYELNRFNRAQIINHYAKIGEWIFLHSNLNPLYSLFILDKYCKRIIWRTWGHDIPKAGGSILKKAIMNHFVFPLWKRKVKKFHLIGIANSVDTINVREAFGNVQMYIIPYPRKCQMTSEIVVGGKSSKDCLNIMIGHSGHAMNKHIEILKALEHLKKENVHLFIPLSYGKDMYISMVQSKARSEWGSKVSILNEMLPYEDYVRFLDSMDIAILPGENSYALGNISLLVRLKKKIYLSNNSCIKKAFDIDGIPAYDFSNLKLISFDELRKKPIYPDSIGQWEEKSYEEKTKMWYDLLCNLDACS